MRGPAGTFSGGRLEVIRGGRPEPAVIDAVTGQKIADPQWLLEGWTSEEALGDSLRKAAR